MQSKLSDWADWLWLIAWSAASSIWCLQAAATLGATFDEPIYLRAGMECWRKSTHEPLLRMGTMPLSIATSCGRRRARGRDRVRHPTRGVELIHTEIDPERQLAKPLNYR